MSAHLFQEGSDLPDFIKDIPDADRAPDQLEKEIQSRIDGKTKPAGSLGVLETIALQTGLVLGTASPCISQPHIIVFAADHGIAAQGVSAYPQEVTAQMVMNFVNGGAAINIFCRQHAIALTVVDAGVNYDFSPGLPVINHKIAKGTRSFLHGPAMEREHVYACLSAGSRLTGELQGKGCNTIGLGEMGIGNTSTAAVLMSMLCDLPLEECIGRGTGVAGDRLAHKHRILQQAVQNYGGDKEVFSILTHFGGYEIIQMAGAMLEARKRGMLILVDGFISTVAFLCAFKIHAPVMQNAVFCHQSDESGHKLLLATLNVRPLLHLGMRLGEGTGCALALPLIQSAVAFLNGMASFDDAGVSKEVV